MGAGGEEGGGGGSPNKPNKPSPPPSPPAPKEHLLRGRRRLHLRRLQRIPRAESGGPGGGAERGGHRGGGLRLLPAAGAEREPGGVLGVGFGFWAGLGRLGFWVGLGRLGFGLWILEV